MCAAVSLVVKYRTLLMSVTFTHKLAPRQQGCHEVIMKGLANTVFYL